MKVIALSGWSGSGKDLCATYIKETYGFKRLAFADPLKDLAALNYNVPREHFHDVNFKEKALLQYPAVCQDSFSDTVIELIEKHLRTEHGTQATAIFEDANGYLLSIENGEHFELYHTPRSLAVLEGSTKRTVDPNHWVKIAIALGDPEGVYVISDLRYRSEVAGLKDAIGAENVITMRVLRFENTDQTDSSERDLDNYDFDYYIDNSEVRQMPKEQVFKQLDEALIKSEIIKP